MTKIRNLLLGAATATALLLPTAVLADGHSEIVNADLHAGYAAVSPAIAVAHSHLHHTVNCLVGPGGNGFDANEMNPCDQSGKGAIPDTADTKKKAALEAAAAKAREGIASSNFADVKKDAAATEAMLKKAE
jgi:hypothetical protein